MAGKQAQQRAARKHYLANKEMLKARAKKYLYEVAQPRNKAYILAYKKAHPCADCPEKDPVVLQFHHVGSDKEANLGDSAVKGWSLARLIREIAKCIVLCANCHLRRHAKKRAELAQTARASVS